MPIAKKVLSKQHKLEEIPIDGQLDHKSEKLAQSVFQPVKQSQHDANLLPFNEISGTNQRPNWYSTDSQNISRGAVDIQLGRCVAKRDPSLRVKEFATLQTSWLGHFVDAKHKLVFTEGDGALYFALHHWQDSVCLVWPALRQTFADKVYFQPKLDEGPKFLHIYKLDTVKCHTFTWKSPAFQATPAGGGQFSDIAIRAHLIGEPVSLLQAAASKAFFSLDSTFLHKLAKHHSITCIAGSSLFETITILVKSILNLSEEAAIDIVALRLAQNSKDGKFASYLLQCDEAMEVLDVHDQKQYREQVKQKLVEKDVAEHFSAQFMEMKDKHRDKANKG